MNPFHGAIDAAQLAGSEECTVRITSRFHRRKETILLVQSHVRASFTSRLTALTSPRMSAGENRRVINEMPMESQQPRFTEQSR
jgi:hypothetical protein